MLALPGCESSVERFYSSRLPFDTPIDWWHQLQGGPIADERPPPPGIGDPYPNLGQIPAKPVPTDAATRGALSARLAAERTQLAREAQQDPITPAIPANARPQATPPARPASAPAAGQPAATPDSPPPMARLDAATAPTPATNPAPSRAAPEPPAPVALQQAAAPRAARPGAPPPGEPIVSGPVPALPSSVPPPPALSGIPAATTAPAQPRPRPEAAVAFLPDSAVLRPESDAALRALAARRAGGPVAILGGGDATAAASPEAQAATLPLAWRRAQAMQAVLLAAGVPQSAMRVDAAALGRGGLARLVN